MSTSLKCPCCGKSGDSPMGIFNWICTNELCRVEVYGTEVDENSIEKGDLQK